MTEKPSPEIRSAQDPAAVPWENAVVWVTTPGGGARLYEWIGAEHIRYVLWTNGNVSITPAPGSVLGGMFQSVVVQGSIVFVGKNVNVG